MKIDREAVAKEAGVAICTVSYVLNNSRKMSDKTVKRVLDAVKKLDYQPNMVARSMVKKESKQIGILLEDISNPLFSSLVSRLEEICYNNGYMINICGGHCDMNEYVRKIVSRQIDAVYLCASHFKYTNEMLDYLITNNVKIVMGGVPKEYQGKVSEINVDVFDAIEKLVIHLKKLGHNNIAYLSSFPEGYQYDYRIDAFKNSVLNHFPESKPIVISDKKIKIATIDNGYILAQKIIEKHKHVSAIICTNDLMAMGAINKLSEAGICVPRDISVTGIDNIEQSKWFIPSLTTIGPDNDYFGQEIFNSLIESIRYDLHTQKKIPVNLYVRNSTGPVNK